MKTLLCLLLLLSGFCTKAQQTYTISGTVSDEKGITLPGVTVFITNTKHITSTDTAGKFSFSHIQPGTYEVVARMIGFDPLMLNITVQNKSVKILAGLAESTTQLNAVTITAKKDDYDPNRYRYLSTFKNNFIGTTVNAQQCELMNPDVLKFKDNDATNTLQATATDFLIIENKALGYRIKYLLTQFEFVRTENKVCTIGGSAYFEEMQGTPEQQKIWEENRRVAYLSSERHFFRALVNNTLKKEGFHVYMLTNNYKRDYMLHGFLVKQNNNNVTTQKDTTAITLQKKRKGLLIAVEMSDVDSLFADDKNTDFKTLTYANKVDTTDVASEALTGLYIVYTGLKELPLFYQKGSPIDLIIKLPAKQEKNRQISMIRPLADKVIIDPSGGLAPAKSFIYTGYWAWQRLADLTPLEYFVDPLAEKEK